MCSTVRNTVLYMYKAHGCSVQISHMYGSLIAIRYNSNKL